MVKKRKIIDKEEVTINKRDKESKQLLAILVTIGVILIILFTVWTLVQKSKKFDYYGMKFERIMYDHLPLYYSKVSVFRGDGQQINYNLYLRNDPRGNRIPVNANIKFRVGTTYVTMNDDMVKCEDTNLALVNLGSFLGGIGVKAKSATSDLTISKETGYPFITCDNAANGTVISLEVGDKTSIEKEGECYTLKVEDCNIINITEKFITETIIQNFQLK